MSSRRSRISSSVAFDPESGSLTSSLTSKSRAFSIISAIFSSLMARSTASLLSFIVTRFIRPSREVLHRPFMDQRLDMNPNLGNRRFGEVLLDDLHPILHACRHNRIELADSPRRRNQYQPVESICVKGAVYRFRKLRYKIVLLKFMVVMMRL